MVFLRSLSSTNLSAYPFQAAINCCSVNRLFPFPLEGASSFFSSSSSTFALVSEARETPIPVLDRLLFLGVERVSPGAGGDAGATPDVSVAGAPGSSGVGATVDFGATSLGEVLFVSVEVLFVSAGLLFASAGDESSTMGLSSLFFSWVSVVVPSDSWHKRISASSKSRRLFLLRR